MLGSTYDAQVIVIGGGPAGASTAWQLARAGIDVLVIDRARFPRDKVCAECLSPEASRLLHAMGALEAVEASAAALTGMAVRAPSGDVIRGDFVASHGYRGFSDRGLAVRRRVLDAILLDRAREAGARVREGVRITDVVRDASNRTTGVRIIDADGVAGELRAPLIVGADGLRSLIAKRLQLASAWRWPRRLALVAHWRDVRGVSAIGEMHVERDGFIGIANVGDGQTNASLVVPAREAVHFNGNASAYYDAWIRRHPHLAPRFVDAQRIEQVRVTGPFASMSRRAWSPGAALVGDAADFFDPFTGEGVYSALRGGELLAPFIVDALSSSSAHSDRALHAYDAARRVAFRGKWNVERTIGAVVAAPWLINRAARSLAADRDMADLLVGVAGDFVPPSAVLNASYIWRVFGASFTRRNADMTRSTISPNV